MIHPFDISKSFKYSYTHFHVLLLFHFVTVVETVEAHHSETKVVQNHFRTYNILFYLLVPVATRLENAQKNNLCAFMSV